MCIEEHYLLDQHIIAITHHDIEVQTFDRYQQNEQSSLTLIQ